MKTAILSAYLFLNAGLLLAQPTLTASNSNPTGGEVFVRHACGVSGYTEGAGGANVNWDYSGLVANQSAMFSYTLCTGSGLCDSFPGSNVTSFYGSSYEYFITDTNQLSKLGTGISGANVYYANPEAILIYPTTYASVYKDTFAFAQPVNGWYGNGVDSFITDAWGTLKLPSGIFRNVLRVHLVSITVDSNDFGSSYSIDTFRVDVYNWYTPGIHNPLLSMHYDFVGIHTAPELAQVFYYEQVPMGIASIQQEQNSLKADPNPARDILNIEL